MKILPPQKLTTIPYSIKSYTQQLTQAYLITGQPFQQPPVSIVDTCLHTN